LYHCIKKHLKSLTVIATVITSLIMAVVATVNYTTSQFDLKMSVNAVSNYLEMFGDSKDYIEFSKIILKADYINNFQDPDIFIKNVKSKALMAQLAFAYRTNNPKAEWLPNPFDDLYNRLNNADQKELKNYDLNVFKNHLTDFQFSTVMEKLPIRKKETGLIHYFLEFFDDLKSDIKQGIIEHSSKIRILKFLKYYFLAFENRFISDEYGLMTWQNTKELSQDQKHLLLSRLLVPVYVDKWFFDAVFPVGVARDRDDYLGLYMKIDDIRPDLMKVTVKTLELNNKELSRKNIQSLAAFIAVYGYENGLFRWHIIENDGTDFFSIEDDVLPLWLKPFKKPAHSNG